MLASLCCKRYKYFVSVQSINDSLRSQIRPPRNADAMRMAFVSSLDCKGEFSKRVPPTPRHDNDRENWVEGAKSGKGGW